MLPLNNQPANGGYPMVNAASPAAKGGSAYAKVLEILMVFASKWYWFILCLALGLAGSYLYLQITPPIYTRSASILIKNELQSSASSSTINMFGGSVDVQNELFTLRSSSLAESTVRNLHLEVNCYAQGRFHEEIIYGTALSVQIIPLDLNDSESAEFMFDLKNDGSYVMSNFVRSGEKMTGSITGKVGRTVRTPIGQI